MRGNLFLSLNISRWWNRGWLHVDPDDHLHRGDNEGGLRSKLDTYLRQQVCVAGTCRNRGRLNLPEKFPYSWLSTELGNRSK